MTGLAVSATLPLAFGCRCTALSLAGRFDAAAPDGYYNVTSAFLDVLKRTQGAIVNISSIAGLGSGFSNAGYGSQKVAWSRSPKPCAASSRGRLTSMC